jgi:hypothetical protein
MTKPKGQRVLGVLVKRMLLTVCIGTLLKPATRGLSFVIGHSFAIRHLSLVISVAPGSPWPTIYPARSN